MGTNLALKIDDWINPVSISNLGYKGTLDDVLADVAKGPSHTQQVLHPPRIIRAIVDYKINHPHLEEAEDLLKDAIAECLEMYRDPNYSSQGAVKLRNKVHDLGLEDLLTKPLTQPSDMTTLKASSKFRSDNSAHSLVAQAESKDVLFIALGHGGVGAGMDVFLKYCDLTGSTDSAFYVARLSTQKLGDPKPRLSPTEIEYLKKLGNKRQVIIFDEDSFSGRTIEVAKTYFSRHVFPLKRVIPLINLNARAELIGLGYKNKLLEVYGNFTIDREDQTKIDPHNAIFELYTQNIIHKPNHIITLYPSSNLLKKSKEEIPYQNKEELFLIQQKPQNSLEESLFSSILKTNKFSSFNRFLQ